MQLDTSKGVKNTGGILAPILFGNLEVSVIPLSLGEHTSKIIIKQDRLISIIID